MSRECRRPSCKNKDNGASPGICKKCGSVMEVVKKVDAKKEAK